MYSYYISPIRSIHTLVRIQTLTDTYRHIPTFHLSEASTPLYACRMINIHGILSYNTKRYCCSISPSRVHVHLQVCERVHMPYSFCPAPPPTPHPPTRLSWSSGAACVSKADCEGGGQCKVNAQTHFFLSVHVLLSLRTPLQHITPL